MSDANRTHARNKIIMEDSSTMREINLVSGLSIVARPADMTNRDAVVHGRANRKQARMNAGGGTVGRTRFRHGRPISPQEQLQVVAHILP